MVCIMTGFFIARSMPLAAYYVVCYKMLRCKKNVFMRVSNKNILINVKYVTKM